MPEEPRELTFREKCLTLQVNTGRSRPVRREPLDANGRRMRTVERPTDSGAHVTVTNRSDTRGDHQDVTVDMGVIDARRPQ
ncbi:hypothetical protein GCM10009555_017350 [Acrocarpospora macrocephala]|uniref:Uncharacterized protein n=1 Tax=Acrocarpospora macrocephala TaxID=150177 RepID=A0A5M3WE82_9ACTN|nr:hypothetical protein [Acrocarpospora macrocephala]GES07395.1 hypothetical protein Amac_009900 [Acrocarpospora macrocephala]